MKILTRLSTVFTLATVLAPLAAARSFAEGDFEKPLMTHGEMPPGVATMQRLKAKITYTYDFLRYQIREHATGDPLTVR